jgi:hypothetical protein
VPLDPAYKAGLAGHVPVNDAAEWKLQPSMTHVAKILGYILR